MNSNLNISLLGGFHIQYNGKPLTGFQSMRLKTILAYLILHRDTPQSRQYLAFSFWPDSNETQALTNLRQVLYHLRQALPDCDTFLQIDNREVCWKRDAPYTLDVAMFERQLDESRTSEKKNRSLSIDSLEKAIELYKGDLFPECYEAWIEPLRDKLNVQYAEALDKLIVHFENDRDYRKAIYFAERLLFTDRLREKTYLDLMRLHALNQDRASSIRVYKECVEVLSRELDIEPGAHITAFHNQLIRSNNESNLIHQEKEKALDDHLPMVGRQKNWINLKQIWKEVIKGDSHFVIISGEAGIGKTRLAKEFVRWTSSQNYLTASTRCYAAENTLAYTPVNEWLRSGSIKQHLRKLDNVYLTEIARLLPELIAENPELPAPKKIEDRWQRRNFLEAIARAILSTTQPTLLFIDDLQWSDHETLEWIHFLLHYGAETPLFVLGTARIEEVDSDHPLREIVHSLSGAGKVSEIELQPIGVIETGILAERMFGQELDDELRKQLYHETEGNPLFLIESVHALMSGNEISIGDNPEKSLQIFRDNHERGLLPDRVMNVIRSRFKMVTDQARKVASCAAAIGRNFRVDLLAMVTGFSETELRPLLEELLQRRLLREQEGDKLDFGHDKFREVAYSILSPSEKTAIHEKIAKTLTTTFDTNPDVAESQIAFHYDKAGKAEKAIQFYERAALHAQQMYAHQEALKLLRRALELLQTLPESRERDRHELSMRLVLGPLLVAIKGYHAPEVREDYHRIHILSNRLGQTVSPPVLRSMALSCVVQGDLTEAFRLGKQILEVAEQEKRSILSVEGYYVAGISSFWLGNFNLSEYYLKKAIDHYDDSQEKIHIEYYVQHPKVICQIRLGWSLLYLGYPQQALAWQKRSLENARKCGHPFSLAYSLIYSSIIQAELGDFQAARILVDECVKVTDEHGFRLWYMIAIVYQSWLYFKTDGVAAHVDEMERRLTLNRDSGILLKNPFYGGLLAQARLELGDTEAALHATTQALNYAEERGECWSYAEIFRIRGLILHQAKEDQNETEKWFLKALNLAKKQDAKLFELRTALNLARLWAEQGKISRAEKILREGSEQFPDGFDLPDMKEAARLIEKLANTNSAQSGS